MHGHDHAIQRRVMSARRLRHAIRTMPKPAAASILDAVSWSGVNATSDTAVSVPETMSQHNPAAANVRSAPAGPTACVLSASTPGEKACSATPAKIHRVAHRPARLRVAHRVSGSERIGASHPGNDGSSKMLDSVLAKEQA